MELRDMSKSESSLKKGPFGEIELHSAHFSGCSSVTVVVRGLIFEDTTELKSWGW